MSDRKMLNDSYYRTYTSLLDIDIKSAFNEIKERERTVENFRFYTAVSVMASSRIEGEQMEVDSYVKHKVFNIEYLPELTEKPNDLYRAYEFARDNSLTLDNFFKAHTIATAHLLPQLQRGVIRNCNMVIMEQQTFRVQYKAALAGVVESEFQLFWSELTELNDCDLSEDEVFYYAALIHLVFVKIHPFNDGNGRMGRLLEKWFLTTRLGEKAWYIGSEYYYYQNLPAYYNNLVRLGLFYDELQYEKGLPFLLMLPNALSVNK